MKRKTKIMIGVAASAVVGLAIATPILNLASPLLAVGQNATDVRTHGFAHAANGATFDVKLKIDGPSTVSIQDGAYGIGGHNGWHSHPGMVAVTLISGSIQWFDENCVETDYTAGNSWFEGSQLHYFRVVGATGIHVMATFITMQGVPLRTDEPAPPCAAALGLD